MQITELLHLNKSLRERYQGYAQRIEAEGIVADSYEEWLGKLVLAQGKLLVRIEEELSQEGHATIQSFLTRNMKKPSSNPSFVHTSKNGTDHAEEEMPR